MVKLRLLRMGRHKAPTFRLVAVDSKSKANGSYIELIGDYKPLNGTKTINEYNAIKWLANGAQPTDTAKSLLKEAGIWVKFIELKDKKELKKYLVENSPIESKTLIEKPKKEKIKKVQEEPKVEEIDEVVQEEPKVEEIDETIDEELDEEELDDDEDDEDDEIIGDDEIIEEAPEIEEIVEKDEDLVLSKAQQNVVHESGISNAPIRKTNDHTIVLTAKTRRVTNITLNLPTIDDYKLNNQTPTSISYELKENYPHWVNEGSKLIGREVKILEPLELKVIITLSLNDKKLSFILTIIINPADEKQSDLNLKNESKLVTQINEDELNKRENEHLSVISSADVAKTNIKPNTIIISMHHKYIEEIVNEEKEILFFKRLPANKVERVIVYCIKPIGKVVGEFILKSTSKLSKTEAWKQYGSKSTFSKTEFTEYYQNKKVSKIMEISGFVKYKTPKELSSYNIKRGPSGFRYLK